MSAPSSVRSYLTLFFSKLFTKNSFTKILTNNNSTRKWFISVTQSYALKPYCTNSKMPVNLIWVLFCLKLPLNGKKKRLFYLLFLPPI